jgi:hypothetical protein
MGSVRPVWRFNALRGLILRPPRRPKSPVGPPCPCAPLQRHLVRAPRAPSCRSGFPDPAPVARAASRGFSCPSTHAGHRGSSLSTVDPSTIRATSGVWLPPSRPYRLHPPGAVAPERPWASPSKAFPSLAMGTPLGAPALLTLPGAIPSAKRVCTAAAFRALFPRRVRAAVRRPKPEDRRCLHGIFPFRAFPPSVRAPACSRGADLLALGRDDVPTRLGLEVSRIGWIGFARFRAASSRGVSHLATVVALHSRIGGRAHGFASRGTLLDRQCRPRSKPPR